MRDPRAADGSCSGAAYRCVRVRELSPLPAAIFCNGLEADVWRRYAMCQTLTVGDTTKRDAGSRDRRHAWRFTSGCRRRSRPLNVSRSNAHRWIVPGLSERIAQKERCVLFALQLRAVT